MIGQSLGGVIGAQLHKDGWNVQKLIAIASPLRGARIINQLKDTLCDKVRSFLEPLLMREVYNDLNSGVEFKVPPHDYYTISTSWPGLDFDGCVYRDEATIDHEKHHHIPWSDHRFVFFSWRLLSKLHGLV